MSGATSFAALAREKYVSLETFRRSGQGVRTPVWFAAAPDATVLYVFTTRSTGKVKRIRNNDAVRIAVCNRWGRVTGSWLDGRARLVDGAEADRAMQALGRKYWPMKQVLDAFAGLTGGLKDRVIIAIRPA